ncbi:hypothetical protein OE88DRAFT_1045550 [Heliocybe sulcata]|uniref:Uncharacterized protein n=1 Tax=Heliocybe sulcata TaxID=5364 RepID=A0A5C3MLF5_9AGAM|nr:hypothetical protein OE88DRAFT_1045550 [Heliocybe sulcata]
MLYSSLRLYWTNVARNFFPFKASRHSHSWRHLQGPQPRLTCCLGFEECSYAALGCASISDSDTVAFLHAWTVLSSLGSQKKHATPIGSCLAASYDRGRTIGKMARRWWPQCIISLVRDMVRPSPDR